MKPTQKMVDVAKIDINGSPKVRAELHEEAVAEYAQAYRAKKPLPKPTLFEVEKDHYLVADGLHRIAAMTDAKIGLKPFDVFQGTYADCLKYALRANLAHGLRRTNSDKRAGVIAALQEFPKMSNGAISEIAAAGDDLVREVRKELESEKKIPETPTRTSVSGVEKTVPHPRKTRMTITEPPVNNVKAHHSDSVQPDPKHKKLESDNDNNLKDDTGYPVPPELVNLWQRGSEVQQLLTSISRIKTAVSNGQKDKCPLYGEVNFSSVLADLANAYNGINRAKPYAVCPKCQGRAVTSKNCLMCKGRGIVSKLMYDRIPPEQKKLREAVVAKQKYEI